jgi:hypothetical protein
MIASTTTQINWTILFAQLPSLIGIMLLITLATGAFFMITFMWLSNLDLLDGCSSKIQVFCRVSATMITILLIGFGIYKWINWSNETLSKQENQNKPIIEHIQEK